MIDAPFGRAFRPPAGPGLYVATGPVTLIYDTFTGTNGTKLPAHTPDINTPGSSWETLNKDYTLSSNQAVSPTYLNPTVIDSGFTDCKISLVLYGTGAGISYRALDINNYYFFYVPTTTELRLYENTSGFIIRGSATVSTISFPATIHVELLGDVMLGYLDGYSGSITYSTAVGNTEKKHGLYSNGSPIDNFKVTTW